MSVAAPLISGLTLILIVPRMAMNTAGIRVTPIRGVTAASVSLDHGMIRGVTKWG